MIPPTEIMLDLRRWTGRVKEPADILTLWQRLEPALTAQTLRQGGRYEYAIENGSIVAVLVLSTPHSGFADYSVQGLIETPLPVRRCRLCDTEGTTGAGEFQCEACRGDVGKDWGVCARHVRVLDGAYGRGRLAVSCGEHAPLCAKCGLAADFWCRGPACRGRKTWCRAHGKSHRNTPETSYCPECYDLVFPQCSSTGCAEPGVNSCEHVVAVSSAVCGTKLCNRHVARWQVYGYERVGLARCQLHRRIKELNDDDVIWQVVAGTAVRHVRAERGDEQYFLPTLGSVKNILIKGRNQFYDESQALALYQSLQAQIRSRADGGKLVDKMRWLLDRAASSWGRRIVRMSERRAEGAKYFALLLTLLQRKGEFDLAEAIAMSDFIPNFVRGNPPKPGLFVRIPATLRGRFIGSKGVNIRAYSAQLGCEVELEKEERS